MSNLIVKMLVPNLTNKSLSFLRPKIISVNYIGLIELPYPCGVKRFSSGKQTHERSLSKANEDTEISTNVKEVVKETTKTVSYMGVILAGIGVTTVMFYTIFSELFSKKSPNNVYSSALDKCISDTRISDALGEPIKGFGEETKRGRRRYTKHVIYNREGIEHLRMQFYLKGSRNQGTVHLEMKEDGSGEYVYRYLFVQLDDYSRRVIVLEDNRTEKLIPLSPPRESLDFSSPLNLS